MPSSNARRRCRVHPTQGGCDLGPAGGGHRRVARAAAGHRGIAFELGLSTEVGNALLLYLTNLAAIVFSAGIVLLLSGFRPEVSGRGALRKRPAFTLLAVLIVAVPLFRHTRSVIRDFRLESPVVRSVENWDPDARIVEINADVADGEAVVELLIVSRGDPPPVWEFAERIRTRFGGPVDLEVLYQGDEYFSVSAR